ncbi:MAG: protein jag [Candidatus Eisenbacteria bacterium]|nr:protein jag [Candidatus Eisenbacteria bacterium]
MDEHLANCIETEGKTVDDAVKNAISRLGVQDNDVEIEVLDEGSRGVFNILGTRQARVRVRLKTPPALPMEPAEVVKGLISIMGFDAPVHSSEAEDATVVTIGSTGADGLLIGKRGETLECLQHIVSKMLNRGATEDWKHVVVDVGDYRKRRESQLVKLARSMAERVQATREEFVTEPLKASERRVIHVTLKDSPTVKSFAVGEGLVKRVVIAVKEAGQT